MYVGKHAWYIYVHLHVLSSIFIQADMHGYVGMYICIHVCRHVGMHKAIDVIMCACIIFVCMHVHMYGGKNPYVCRQT